MCCNIWFQCFLNTCQICADASADSGQPPHSGLLLLILLNNQKYKTYFMSHHPQTTQKAPRHTLAHWVTSAVVSRGRLPSKTTHPPNAKVGFKCKLPFILNNIFLSSITAYLCKSLSRHFCKYLQILAVDSDDSERPAAPGSKSNPILGDLCCCHY